MPRRCSGVTRRVRPWTAWGSGGADHTRPAWEVPRTPKTDSTGRWCWSALRYGPSIARRGWQPGETWTGSRPRRPRTRSLSAGYGSTESWMNCKMPRPVRSSATIAFTLPPRSTAASTAVFELPRPRLAGFLPPRRLRLRGLPPM